MKLITAYQKLRTLQVPIFQVNEIAIFLGVSNKYGHKLLSQLAAEGLLIHLRRNLWAFREKIEPFMLPDYLTAPMPSYISLQSALYYHGLISQIPSIIYAISIARTRRYQTPLGIYSIHHIQPDLFFGFDIIGENSIMMAKPEKALFDFFYLKAAKTKLFSALPELEIPKKFNWQQLKIAAEKIAHKGRRTMVCALITQFSH